MMRAMEHSRKAATEGWRLLATTCVVVPALFFGSLFADMGTTMRIMWAIFLVIASSLAVAYAINNIRTSGSFIVPIDRHHPHPVHPRLGVWGQLFDPAFRNHLD